jgi:ribosomal protein L7Ae-like RNA K-turn-binding protein
MNEKLCSLLGLAMRAGKIKHGEDAVLQSIRSEQAKLVFLANDASEATYKKMSDKCSYYRVTLHQMSDRATLGRCIGKETRVSLAVIDEGFAKSMSKWLDSENEVDHIEKRKR